jgi:acylphosphatase
MAARRFVVSGRVQGVGFRWFAVRAAERLGVRGWVRNLPDGRVEATVAGDEAALVAFGEELRRGPRAAHVIDVASEDAPEPPGGFAGFEVR